MKYLEVHFGVNYKITQLDHFGLFLMEVLRRKWDRKRYEGYMAAYTAQYPMFYNTKEFLRTDRVHFTSENIVCYNNFVESIIKAEFHAFMELYLNDSTTIANVIESYRKIYNWTDDDISLDSLSKSFQRYQKKKKNRLKSQKSLGSLSSTKISLKTTAVAA
ncbi:MAG: hypothetical protein ACO1OQ_12830 [Rufibacter sp.]